MFSYSRKAGQHYSWWLLGNANFVSLQVPVSLPLPALIAEHDMEWYGLSLGISCPSCVLSCLCSPGLWGWWGTPRAWILCKHWSEIGKTSVSYQCYLHLRSKTAPWASGKKTTPYPMQNSYTILLYDNAYIQRWCTDSALIIELPCIQLINYFSELLSLCFHSNWCYGQTFCKFSSFFFFGAEATGY